MPLVRSVSASTTLDAYVGRVVRVSPESRSETSLAHAPVSVPLRLRTGSRTCTRDLALSCPQAVQKVPLPLTNHLFDMYRVALRGHPGEGQS
jgi:hypothetical protein